MLRKLLLLICIASTTMFGMEQQVSPFKQPQALKSMCSKIVAQNLDQFEINDTTLGNIPEEIKIIIFNDIIKLNKISLEHIKLMGALFKESKKISREDMAKAGNLCAQYLVNEHQITNYGSEQAVDSLIDTFLKLQNTLRFKTATNLVKMQTIPASYRLRILLSLAHIETDETRTKAMGDTACQLLKKIFFTSPQDAIYTLAIDRIKGKTFNEDQNKQIYTIYRTIHSKHYSGKQYLTGVIEDKILRNPNILMSDNVICGPDGMPI
jgi:hypothetical protein